MKDKERILTQIIALTAFATQPIHPSREEFTHWEVVGENTKIEIGDIICGTTKPNHDFGVSFFEKRIENGMIVKEIGSTKKCSYTNEMFMVLRKFPEQLKLCGTEYKTMKKVQNALWGTCTLRFAGIKFNFKSLEIIIRRKWTTETLILNFDYNCTLSKITVKSLKAAIKELEDGLLSSPA